MDLLIAPQIAAELRSQLRALLPVGHRFPVPAAELAEHLGVSERTVGGLVADLIEQDDVLVGSSCDPEMHGYFLVQTSEDLELGTSHLRARARAIYRRVAKVERLAKERFADPEVLRLFSFDEDAGGTPDGGPQQDASRSGSGSPVGVPAASAPTSNEPAGPSTDPSSVPPTTGASSNAPTRGQSEPEGSHDRASRGGPEPVDTEVTA